MTPVSTLVPPSPPTAARPKGNWYRLVVPNSASAPRIARDFIGSLLHTTGHAGLADDARLCVSEVVTNCHLHTCSRLVRVEVRVGVREATVYVRDNRPHALPVPGADSSTNSVAGQEHGRGLWLVESVAARWGVKVYGGRSPLSKAVWFTLADAEAEAVT